MIRIVKHIKLRIFSIRFITKFLIFTFSIFGVTNVPGAADWSEENFYRLKKYMRPTEIALILGVPDEEDVAHIPCAGGVVELGFWDYWKENNKTSGPDYGDNQRISLYFEPGFKEVNGARVYFEFLLISGTLFGPGHKERELGDIFKHNEELITQGNFNKLRVGMGRLEVANILGQPHVETTLRSGKLLWKYWGVDGYTRISLYFVEDYYFSKSEVPNRTGVGRLLLDEGSFSDREANQIIIKSK